MTHDWAIAGIVDLTQMCLYGMLFAELAATHATQGR